jgi:hypothetical protein
MGFRPGVALDVAEGDEVAGAARCDSPPVARREGLAAVFEKC